MIELASVRDEIDANAAEIWSVLADFGHPERLASTIDATRLTGEGVGAVRIIKSSRGHEIHEELLEFDPTCFRIRYRVLGNGDMPFAGVTSYQCTIALYPLSDTSTEIFWRSEGTVDGPIGPIREFLTKLYQNANKQLGGK